jgi:hypothetical protein
VSELIRGSLELFRAIVLVLLVGVIVSSLVTLVYHLIHLTIGGLGFFAVFIASMIILFILYRNKFQFHGFYRGKSLVKLSEKTTRVLIIIAAALLIIAPFLK